MPDAAPHRRGGGIRGLGRDAARGPPPRHAARQQELPLGDAGRTLEDMVRELMRPHLKEWLDAHLPRLVERLVRDEINRLVRDAQER